MAVSGKTKIKQANQKWRHEQKRKQKARNERVRIAQAIQSRGRLKHQKRASEIDYVNRLGAEIQQ